MIFVTGGTGFLGRHLVPALCHAGHSVRVLTRHPQQNGWLRRYTRVEIVSGDLLQPETFAPALKGCRSVIHAGGVFRFWGDEKVFYETNARGTEHLAHAAADAGVERFVHISTIAVVGQPDPRHVIDEMYPPKPADPYQMSKLHGEQIVLRHLSERNLPAIILRPGAYYGPGGHYAFNRLFFKDPMRGIIMQINSGQYIIFPVYIEDVVQGIMKALERGQVGEIYNICGDWISHREAFDVICEEANLPWPRLPIPGWMGINMSRILTFLSNLTHTEPFWPINLRSYVYNNWRVSSEKARRELNFVPTAFREGARRTIAWYKAGEPEYVSDLECV